MSPNSNEKQTSPENEPYSVVFDEVRRLLSQESEPLYGEESEGESEVTGLRRSFTLDEETGSPATIGIALYDAAARESMQGLLRGKGIEVDSPIGHIEFSKTIGEAHLSGMIYLEESTHQLRAFLIGKKDGVEAGPENWACYELADNLGVGKVWAGITAVTEYAEKEVLCDDRMAGRLASFLSGLGENP